MSHPDNKDILQEIMNEQKKLDRNIIKTHDLFNNNNEVDLTANFDELRKEKLLQIYSYIRGTTNVVRHIGAKWWKNQQPLTEEHFAETMDQLANDTAELAPLTNISMKNMAVFQELIELEDAIKDGKTKDEIYDEYVDIIHFVISLGLGINSAETIKEYYLKKNNVNHNRIQSNY
jgi:dimeric dUTPase (all-alpha-NTP-PPase superfamily)